MERNFIDAFCMQIWKEMEFRGLCLFLLMLLRLLIFSNVCECQVRQ